MNIIRTNNYEVAVNTYGDNSAPRIALLLPGRLDTKDYANFVSHAEYLSKKGFYVITVDPPYTWDSPGKLDNYTTTNYVQAANELIDYFGKKPTLLLGHSRGGATAMLVSSNPAIIGVVVVNSAFGSPSAPKPGEMKNGILLELRDLPPGNIRTEEKKKFELPEIYFADGAKHNPEGAFRMFNGPKLVVHANKDEFVSLDEVTKIYDSLSEPKMFLEINSTHDYRLFPEAINEVNKALGVFIDRHI